MLATVDLDALDPLGRARVDVLRGEIAFDQIRADEAAPLLVEAARRLEPVDVGLARRTYLEALGAAMFQGDTDGPSGLRAIARAALLAPTSDGAPTAIDALLDAFALRFTEGHRQAAPVLRRALDLVRAPGPTADDHGHWMSFAVSSNAITLTQELWDAEAWRTLAARQVQFSRDTGAIVQLQFGLSMLAWVAVLAGELGHATQLLDYPQTIAVATGNGAVWFPEFRVAAARGDDHGARTRI
ncbi:MAG: LuxR family transcriptional regulator, partial [Ilumatobacteraceae bacterium]